EESRLREVHLGRYALHPVCRSRRFEQAYGGGISAEGGVRERIDLAESDGHGGGIRVGGQASTRGSKMMESGVTSNRIHRAYLYITTSYPHNMWNLMLLGATPSRIAGGIVGGGPPSLIPNDHGNAVDASEPARLRPRQPPRAGHPEGPPAPRG